MKNGDQSTLETVSPFREIPRYDTLTGEQLEYVHGVARVLCQSYFDFIGECVLPIRETEPVLLGLDDVKHALNRSRSCAVYSHSKPFLSTNGVRVGKHPTTPELARIYGDRTEEREFGARVLVVETGGLLHFSYDPSEYASYSYLKNGVLYNAGIPVLMSDVLTFDPLMTGNEILNVRTRKRLGDGIPAGERKRHVILKLAEPDENGNLVWDQQVK